MYFWIICFGIAVTLSTRATMTLLSSSPYVGIHGMEKG
jgi:hypothetical protein